LRHANLITAALVACLAMKAAAVAQVYPKSTYRAVRQDGIHLAADLARGACKYYASNATTQLCIETTKPACKMYHLSAWYRDLTCNDVQSGACQYYEPDGSGPFCSNTTRIACKKNYLKSTFYPDESCSD
jgi:hypothetical protein